MDTKQQAQIRSQNIKLNKLAVPNQISDKFPIMSTRPDPVKNLNRKFEIPDQTQGSKFNTENYRSDSIETHLNQRHQLLDHDPRPTSITDHANRASNYQFNVFVLGYKIMYKGEKLESIYTHRLFENLRFKEKRVMSLSSL